MFPKSTATLVYTFLFAALITVAQTVEEKTDETVARCDQTCGDSAEFLFTSCDMTTHTNSRPVERCLHNGGIIGSGVCCTLLETQTVQRSTPEHLYVTKKVQLGRGAAERWGCQDVSCHEDLGVTGAPVYDWDVHRPFDRALRPPSNSTRFAVCIAGQLRSAGDSFVAESMASRLISPLDADIFVEASSEERDTRYHSVNKASVRYFMHALNPVHMRLITDRQLRRYADTLGSHDSERGRGVINARWRRCLLRIREAEKTRDRPYQWVLRLRPDSVWSCKFVPPTIHIWPVPLDSQPAASLFSNEAAIATRSAAEYLLNFTKDETPKDTTLFNGMVVTEGGTPGLDYWLYKNSVHVTKWASDHPSMMLSCSTNNNHCRMLNVQHIKHPTARECQRPCMHGVDSACTL
mmetsp:Transcript_14060/g.34044  ORF Transcript_14060/g.34044 Transcript_14060/m.34044 type:complete len:407 (-) Transcript_14060:153-1373(-)